MRKNAASLQVDKLRPYVLKSAKRFDLSAALIYAVIETESSFNPYAASAVSAYGLMQIVPKTAGRDVSNHLNKRDDNTSSREFCTIAAYNTGSGNVLKTFHNSDRNKAARIINNMLADDVYRRLRSSLPYDETRRYIQKVITAKKRYINI